MLNYLKIYTHISIHKSFSMECPQCHKILANLRSLKYHIDHNVCQKNTFICPLCQNSFTTLRGLNYHKNNNVCKKNKIPLKLKKNNVPSTNVIDSDPYLNLTKEEMRIKIVQLQAKVETLQENPQTVNNNNIIVFPSSFGKEDMKHVRETLGDILKPMVTRHPAKSIPILFNKLHNNEKLPEYHNVYISSERSSYAMVSDGQMFKHRSKKTIIDQIIEDKRSILNQYVDDNGEQLGDKVLQKYEQYQNDIDANSELRKELEIEIGGLLLDMKSVIANDEKTRRLLDKVNEGQY